MNLADMKNLTNLARMEVSDAELEALAKDFDSILGYVGQIKDAAVDAASIEHFKKNAFRDDIAVPFENPRALVDAASEHADGFVKVPKVME